jgi:uncharacterized repeat protein (TIGR03803 family)
MTNLRARFTLSCALACTAVSLSLTVCAQAQTFTFLATFNGTDGSRPVTVVQATDGNYYGAAYADGPNNSGTLFRITPSGEVTTIYSFCSLAHCADGALPGPAILGKDGNLYGVTYGGGYDATTGYGLGTVYKATLDGQLTTLHTFCTQGGECPDGGNPWLVIQASDGTFYGTTGYGGNGTGGLLFGLTPAGEYRIVHSFCSLWNCADGYYPSGAGGLIQGIDGNLYGTAIGGGAYGGGVVFSVTPSGRFSVVRSFGSKPRYGGAPFSLVQDAKGKFFGVTEWGGGTDGGGVIFEMDLKQQFNVLHSFTTADNGGLSDLGLTLGNDGNFYGTTPGENGYGTIYSLTPHGAYTTLYQLPCCDNSIPSSGLVQLPDGSLYGTSTYYGLASFGALYRFDNNLSPLVQTVPRMGKVGTKVLILGDHLTGTSSVTFNGVAAAFTVESDTYIKATVPGGATTGAVSVATPSGTLNSNPQFVVTK